MPDSRPLTFLCITTYEKGQEFMRECKRQGHLVILLTAEKLRDADWPRESLDDTFYLPNDIALNDIVAAVTHLARTKKIDRIVALDEYDMETAATLREHLRVEGMGLTTMRYFRDKLAMRMKALDRGVRVPDFVPVFNHDDIRYYLDHVPGPWVLKPRQEASAIGIKKLNAAEELWPVLDQLGDKQSSLSAGEIRSRRGLSRRLGSLGKRSSLLERQQIRQAAYERSARRRSFHHVHRAPRKRRRCSLAGRSIAT